MVDNKLSAIATKVDRPRVFQDEAYHHKLDQYLKSLEQSKEVDPITAELAWKAWRDLRALSSDRLPVPSAGAGPDGEILFTWNKDFHHFELEVFPNGLGEFFYLNHQTDEMWDYEYQIGDSIPEDVMERLRLLFPYD